MEITCPSCSTKHDTSLYPDAFEIQCSCGYSILIPNEEALNQAESYQTQSENIASSVEEEDQAFKISAPQGLSPDPMIEAEEAIAEQSFAAAHMTPSEELPEGMVYDPSEVPSADSEDIPGWANLTPPEPSEESLDAPPETNEFDESALNAQSSPEKTPAKPSSQRLIEKTLAAQVGQFLGESFDVRFSALSPAHLQSMENECLKFLVQRPWLEDELKKRKLQLIPLKSEHTLSDVPEILAVELYLLCMQLGGNCEFKRSALNTAQTDAGLE